jgi:hypothetical protein
LSVNSLSCIQTELPWVPEKPSALWWILQRRTSALQRPSERVSGDWPM